MNGQTIQKPELFETVLRILEFKISEQYYMLVKTNSHSFITKSVNQMPLKYELNCILCTG